MSQSKFVLDFIDNVIDDAKWKLDGDLTIDIWMFCERKSDGKTLWARFDGYQIHKSIDPIIFKEYIQTPEWKAKALLAKERSN